jgi:glyoxylase-like metal-dependent hydrolase (beta-lactamase superfamily II)
VPASPDSAEATIVITGTAQHAAWAQRVLPPPEEVRPGLWSVPVPIPHSPLRYTLAYAFVSERGVVVVDPGWESEAGHDALTAGLAAAGAAPQEVTGIVVTHIHPDHHGASAWLRQASGAWVAMHPAEAETLPARLWRGRTDGTDHAWLRSHGVPEAEMPAMTVSDPARLAGVLALAEPDRYLNDGDRVPAPGRDVHAIWTPGHTPGHLCLHDAAAGVLLTGDHLLPRISPNIGVHGLGETDPLTGYLTSLAGMARFGGDEALPAHEYRFRGIGVRAAGIMAHHRDRADEILSAAGRLAAPAAWPIAAELTWSRGWDALHGMSRRMALAETLAHLRYLVAQGEIHRLGGSPVRWRPAGQPARGR